MVPRPRLCQVPNLPVSAGPPFPYECLQVDDVGVACVPVIPLPPAPASSRNVAPGQRGPFQGRLFQSLYRYSPSRGDSSRVCTGTPLPGVSLPETVTLPESVPVLPFQGCLFQRLRLFQSLYRYSPSRGVSPRDQSPGNPLPGVSLPETAPLPGATLPEFDPAIPFQGCKSADAIGRANGRGNRDWAPSRGDFSRVCPGNPLPGVSLPETVVLPFQGCLFQRPEPG